MVRRAAVIVLLTLTAAACSNDGDVPAPRAVTIVPDLTGYHAIRLGAVESRKHNPPTGTFSYLVVDGAIDWYVVASNLVPARAYRIVLTAADGKEYAVASRRSDDSGTLGAHGVETVLMNRQCVGAEDPSRRSLESAGTLRVAIKRDGSPRGASTNDLLGSRSALPCGGNGDGDFAYVLRSASALQVAP